jgi:excisionase family DNA binding protein
VERERTTLTTADLAARLGVSVWTVRRWTADGTLPPPRVHNTRRMLWSVAQIDQWEKGDAA